MVHPGRRHVGDNQIAANFSAGEKLLEDLFDAAKTLAITCWADNGFRPANRDVLEEAEDAARGKQLLHFCEETIDKLDAEVVERQAGNDKVVTRRLRQIFKTTVHQADSISHGFEFCSGFDLLLQMPDEFVVAFDHRQMIIDSHITGDLRRDRASPRPHFENSASAAGICIVRAPNEMGKRAR